MLVQKGSSVYLYESVRENREIKTVYKGKLSPQQIREHQTRKEEETLRKQSTRQMTALLNDLDEIRVVNDLILRASLLVNNQYVRRSEIRRMNHAY